MEIISYNSELAIANLQFKRIFSNIRISRTNSETGRKSSIPVTCVFEQRSRILKNWENDLKKATYKLPMIVISRTGYSRNGDRLNNINNEIKYELTSKKRIYELLTPIPIDITYDVTIMAKYPSDVDQIASNFMIFFNSDLYVQCAHPKYEYVTLNNQVIMSDQVTEDHPSEIDSSQDDFITSTFNFTFKTYLFGGTQKSELLDTPILSTWLTSYTKIQHVDLATCNINKFMSDYPNGIVSALVLSSEVEEIHYSDIDKYQRNYPTNSITAQINGIISVIPYSEIDYFQAHYPYTNVSGEISSYQPAVMTFDNMSELLEKYPDAQWVGEYGEVVSETLSAYVSKDTSQYTYDGFTPIVKSLSLEFHDVPWKQSFDEYFSQENEPYRYPDYITWTIY